MTKVSAPTPDIPGIGPVGAACVNCLHRGLIERAQLGAHVEKLRRARRHVGALQAGEPLASLPLRCTRCGGNRVEVHVFHSERERKRFMAAYR